MPARTQRKKAKTAPDAFTIPTPKRLPVTFDGQHWWMKAAGKDVRLSNLNKVYWPGRGYTKGDMLAYYFNVAQRILPFLNDRPLTMRRMPDGIDGPRFYAKNAPKHTPDWMPRCRVPNFEDPEDVNDFVMANDVAGLLFVANLGCIDFHPLHARCPTIDKPDYLFFDLDPSEGSTFEDVVAVAMHVRTALDALELPALVKTSGATGLQVFVPIVHGPTFDQTREFVERIGRAILLNDPQRVTMTWEVAKREGKVFIDHNMNRRGQNIAAAYSLRPKPEATFSKPLRWEELEAGARPEDFTMANAHEVLKGTHRDPFLALVRKPIDVRAAMDALGVAA